MAMWITNYREVVYQCIQPHIDGLFGITWDWDSPLEATFLAGHGEIGELLLQPLQDRVVETLRLDGTRIFSEPVKQLRSKPRQTEHIVLLFHPLHLQNRSQKSDISGEKKSFLLKSHSSDPSLVTL